MLDRHPLLAALLSSLVVSACGESDDASATGSQSATSGVGNASSAGPSSTTSSTATSTSSAASSSSSSTGGVTTQVSGDGCNPGQITQRGELQGRYQSFQPVLNGQEYFIQVNQWNMASDGKQTMAVGGGDFFYKMIVQDAEVPTNGGPTGYPSMFIGANAGNVTRDSGLPKQVSAIGSLPTTWVWSDGNTLSNTSANSYNVAYDVWFSTQAGGEPDAYGPSGGYLMVWLYDPPDAEPIGGSPTFNGVSIPGAPGTWDVWIGPNGGRPVVSYVATQPLMSMSFDLMNFIDDAVSNRPNTIQDSWYLTNVFTGFEIWRGGVGLETTAFCVEVQ